MEAILYIGHGTRSKKGMEELKRFLQKIIKRRDLPIQEFCFLKLANPSIQEGIKRCVEKGATKITVVPVFLLAAGHIKIDIPRILTSVAKHYPTVEITVKDPLGVQERILDAIHELIQQTVPDFSTKDSILIVGVGGSDESIPDAFAKLVSGLKLRLGPKQASVCFLASIQPTLEEGFGAIFEKATTNRVVVIPYLLFSGFLLSVVKQKVREYQKLGKEMIQINPLSCHQVIEDIIIEGLPGEEVNNATVIH